MKVSRELAIEPIKAALRLLLSNPGSTDPGLFAYATQERQPLIQKASDIGDYELACLYTYADYFSFCRAHRDKTVGTLTVKGAEQALADALSYLEGSKSGLPSVVLRGGVQD